MSANTHPNLVCIKGALKMITLGVHSVGLGFLQKMVQKTVAAREEAGISPEASGEDHNKLSTLLRLLVVNHCLQIACSNHKRKESLAPGTPADSHSSAASVE